MAPRVAVNAHGRQSHVKNVIADRLRLSLLSAINPFIEENSLATGDVHGVLAIPILQISIPQNKKINNILIGLSIRMLKFSAISSKFLFADKMVDAMLILVNNLVN